VDGQKPGYSPFSNREETIKEMMEKYLSRDTPQVASPTPIRRTDIRDVNVTNLGPAPTITPTEIDPWVYRNIKEAAEGKVPSVGEQMLTRGVSQAGQLGMALAGSRGGYSPAAIRGAQREMSASVQNSAAQAAALRAQEMADARNQLSNLAQNQAAMAQEAKRFNASQIGNFILAQSDFNMKGALANQGIDLDVVKTNAMRGDQFALTQLATELQSMQMNDTMILAYFSKLLGIDEALLSAEVTKMGIKSQELIAQQQQSLQRELTDQAFWRELLKAGIGAGGSVLAKQV
jgi:hypothetical protein